jgi:uncharacterized protein YjbI with pentapeptide repeats
MLSPPFQSLPTSLPLRSAADYFGRTTEMETLPKCAITKRWTGEILAAGDTLKAVAQQAAKDKTNLSGANLSDANLSDANLSGAYLSGANLSDAYLSGADGLPSDLVIKNIDAAILAAIESNGNALNMSDWHTCETTHCRAGWAIHLAGPVGYELEKKIGPNAAGAFIYAASRPDQRVPNFAASNDEAMADIRECAAQQVGVN